MSNEQRAMSKSMNYKFTAEGIKLPQVVFRAAYLTSGGLALHNLRINLCGQGKTP
jgi:hypothetical protein